MDLKQNWKLPISAKVDRSSPFNLLIALRHSAISGKYFAILNRTHTAEADWKYQTTYRFSFWWEEEESVVEYNLTDYEDKLEWSHSKKTGLP